jgi:hypothetical protein
MKRRDILRSLGSLAVGLGSVTLSTLAVARIGRPLSPGSIAGVRRRTRRRTRRRIRRRVALGMTLATLPYGCTQRLDGRVNYYYCGGIWYLPTYQGSTVVYVVHSIDDGADTTIEVEG